MKDFEKINKILMKLNEEYDDDITDDQIVICDIQFSLSEHSEGDELIEYLYSTDDNLSVEFERKGTKRYSYGSWTETYWGMWE